MAKKTFFFQKSQPFHVDLCFFLVYKYFFFQFFLPPTILHLLKKKIFILFFSSIYVQKGMQIHLGRLTFLEKGFFFLVYKYFFFFNFFAPYHPTPTQEKNIYFVFFLNLCPKRNANSPGEVNLSGKRFWVTLPLL